MGEQKRTVGMGKSIWGFCFSNSKVVRKREKRRGKNEITKIETTRFRTSHQASRHSLRCDP